MSSIAAPQYFRVSKCTLMEIYVRYHTPVDPSPPILLVSVYFHRKELRSSGAPELPPSVAAARTGLRIYVLMTTGPEAVSGVETAKM